MLRATLATLVLAAVLVSESAPPAGAAAKGDADCSGTVSSVDAALVLQWSAGLVGSLPCQSDADANHDATLNAVDATLILQLVVGIIDTLPPSGQRLMIHQIDVGQGDAALIVSPTGQTAMIDDGRWNGCRRTTDYLADIGISSIDYHFASHYDADHIGCIDDMVPAGITVETACYDRGTFGSEPTTQTYQAYVATCGDKRRTLSDGQVVSLGAGVTLTVIDLNGAGVQTTEENALGVVLKLTYGSFDAVFAGDLPANVEAIAGPHVSNVEVYKVNHHGSAQSSSDGWLDAIDANVAVLSVGDNSYGHPTAAALDRMHAHEIHVYWTGQGSGIVPSPAWDTIGGSIVIDARTTTYTVSGSGFVDSYTTD